MAAVSTSCCVTLMSVLTAAIAIRLHLSPERCPSQPVSPLAMTVRAQHVPLHRQNYVAGCVDSHQGPLWPAIPLRRPATHGDPRSPSTVGIRAGPRIGRMSHLACAFGEVACAT